MINWRLRWIWILILPVVLLVRHFFIQDPQLAESVYGQFIFPSLRFIFDFSVGLIPLPIFHLFLLFLGWKLFKAIKRKSPLPKWSWSKRITFTILDIASAVALAISLFFILWGYNYPRPDLRDKLSLAPERLRIDEVRSLALETIHKLNTLRDDIKPDTAAITELMTHKEAENLVREALKKPLDSLGFLTWGKGRTKSLRPNGLLRKFGIAGIYVPFFGESYIDNSLHTVDKPFTIAHELSHAYGITHEGEANLMAYIACSKAEDPRLRYSAELRLFRYLLNDLLKMSEAAYAETVSSMSRSVRNDILSIYKNSQLYKPFSIEISKKTNDIYLKTQGVKAGIKSYQELPQLVYEWKTRELASLEKP
ncbi:DUF3810 domain-containing protein [Penaeicola halotolerans]|uniref:DUF3810 domain-containing protein n=1 Tax=Penaeicola halotolerans TaxID=2793196 RepID=UPI001CF8469D|nr:DUF3810 domain-containing protein [Penaeicola halotolerans]